MEQFSDLIKNRRSMRKFTGEEVNQEEVVTLLKKLFPISYVKYRYKTLFGKKLNLKETMIKGYKEMGRINLSLAELGMTDEISLENDSKGDMAKVE